MNRLSFSLLCNMLLFWVCYVANPIAAQEANNTELNSRVNASTSFFRRDKVQTIHLKISDANLAKMKAALPERIYVEGEFRWNEQTFKNVGVRYKGNSSSNPNQQYKRSFLIKFDEFEEGQRILGLRRVALDNGVQFGSLFSEQLITQILDELDIIVPRTNFAKLYLNGGFHGVYTNVERIDSVFLKNHFDDPNGPLYKVDMGGPGAGLEPVPPQVQIKSTTFEPKSKSASDDARDVHDLIAAINKTPDERFRSAMDSNLELDKFLQTMAVMLFSGAFDQLTGWGPHNYYLYRDPADNRWHYLPWDLDVGFSDNAFGRIPVIDGWHAAWPVPGGPPRPLLERIVNDQKLLARYRKFADDILENHFHPSVIVPKLDALYERIRDDLELDPFPHRRVTNPADKGYDDIVKSLKAFMVRRYMIARAQLDNPGERPKPSSHSSQPGQEPRPSKEPTANRPTKLRLVAKTAQSVTLRWSDNAQGEAGHLVQRADGEKAPFRNAIGRPGPESILAADDNVVPGRTYRYRVYAVFHSPKGPSGSSVSNTITVQVPDN